jgi:hypothetical protein
MRASLIIALSFVGVFSLLVLVPVIQESYQLTIPCSADEIPMQSPRSNKIECISPTDYERYLSDGYAEIKRVAGQGTVPAWIKNTATWYGDGSVSQTEFIDAIKHLIDNKVIKLSDAENIKKSILKSKHQVTITDLRFLQCVDLHDEYIKMGEAEFHDHYAHKPFLSICVNFYKDPVSTSTYRGNIEELYKNFQEYASVGVDKSNFQQCMMNHRFYIETTESQFLSKFADRDFINDCVTLYKDPIWEYDEKDRMKKLYSRFVEIESARTGQASPTHTIHSEISYINDLGDGVFDFKLNACAGNTVIHHAKFLIKSSTDSIEIGSYKDIEPNSCRTYSATIHAKNSNDIEFHLMESVEKVHVQTKEHRKPLSCNPGWKPVTTADGQTLCKTIATSYGRYPT